jgi:hypothetical protein
LFKGECDERELRDLLSIISGSDTASIPSIILRQKSYYPQFTIEENKAQTD